jgi:hypothetical protein
MVKFQAEARLRAAILRQEAKIGPDDWVCGSQQGPQKTTCAAQLGARLNPTMRQVTLQIAKVRHVPGCYGACFQVSARIKSFGAALIDNEHDAGGRGLRIGRGYAEGHQASTNAEVLPTCKLQVLKCDEMGS